MRKWCCIGCGRERVARRMPEECECGMVDSWLRRESERDTEGAPAAVRLDQLGEGARIVRVSSGDDALDRVLGGGWAKGSSTLVYGGPGAGKSRLAYGWAARHSPVLLVATEMPEPLTAYTLRDLGLDPARFFYGSERGFRRMARRVRARSVVIDSLSEAEGRPSSLLRELRAWASESGGIGWAIAHENTRGRAFGGIKQEHAPDYVVRVSAQGFDGARLRVAKSRYCGRGECSLSLAPARERVAAPGDRRAEARPGSRRDSERAGRAHLRALPTPPPREADDPETSPAH
jgi:DNA repair protein RadA/Sms